MQEHIPLFAKYCYFSLIFDFAVACFVLLLAKTAAIQYFGKNKDFAAIFG